MKVDLHIHTIASDGVFEKEELLTLADQEDVRILSFTDHNYFERDASLHEQAQQLGVKLIDGVEISAQFDKNELHLLGYNLQELDHQLEEHFRIYAQEKTHQTKLRCERSVAEPLILKSGQQISVSFAELQQNQGRKVFLWNDMMYTLTEKYNRHKRPEDPHMTNYFAKNLLMGIHPTYEKYKDAFQNLEKGKCLWYVYYPLTYPPAGEVIYLVQKSGGLTCLAHPGEQELGMSVIRELRQVGLDALEVNTPKNKDQLYYAQIAQGLGLLTSSGTDFHYLSRYHRLGKFLENPSLSDPQEKNYTDLETNGATILERLL